MPINKRNACMLGIHNQNKAYDWWWHSLSAENARTGELESFFIEYYVINQGRGGKQPVFGQIPGKPAKPSYAMIKAGKWGANKTQIHNFWGIDDFEASRKKMEVRIGGNKAGETYLKGSVSLDPQEAKKHPDYVRSRRNELGPESVQRYQLLCRLWRLCSFQEP